MNLYTITRFIDRHPMISFYISLVLLVGLIALSNFIRKPQPAAKTAAPAPKLVSVYRIGSAPKITVQAQTEKSGVVQITALTGGVVQTIYHQAGETVKKGDWLIGTSTNYQGGNALAIQRQIAQKSYQNLKDTYQTSREIIDKQREVANKSNDDAKEQRDITSKSLGETRDLITFNEDTLKLLDDNIKSLEDSHADKSLIAGAKLQKSGLIAATNQARQALRLNEYTANSDKPPAQLKDINRDITLKQLDVQQKMLDVQLETARLNFVLYQVNEALMYPAAPFSGTVQRVFVKVGQQVTPGTPLLVLSQVAEEDPITAIAYVPKDIAQRISRLEPSTLHLSNGTYTSYPSYISTEAVQGSLYAIYFPIPDSYSGSITDKGYIRVDIPIGYYDTNAVAPYVPIDAVYQTADTAYVFVVAKDHTAAAKQLEIGQVYGRFVEVKSGLSTGDEIITDRTVVGGDAVTIAK